MHSPFMYELVRKLCVRGARRDFVGQLESFFGMENVVVVNDVSQLEVEFDVACSLCSENEVRCVVLREPFVDVAQRDVWRGWYDEHHCVAAYFQGWMVVVVNPKFQKQYYCIR